MESKDILSSLLKSYAHDKFITIPELRIGTGYGKSAMQRFDLWILNCYPSEGHEKICYEIKISRSDFLSEIKNPIKRRWALRYSNYFYFACPKGLVKKEEIPLECGLMEFEKIIGFENKEIITMNKIIDAPYRETFRPTWGLIASILRRQI